MYLMSSPTLRGDFIIVARMLLVLCLARCSIYGITELIGRARPLVLSQACHHTGLLCTYLKSAAPSARYAKTKRAAPPQPY
jgi:hypothetical protein